MEDEADQLFAVGGDLDGLGDSSSSPPKTLAALHAR
jgi:hypothetical protein